MDHYRAKYTADQTGAGSVGARPATVALCAELGPPLRLNKQQPASPTRHGPVTTPADTDTHALGRNQTQRTQLGRPIDGSARRVDTSV